MTAAFDIDRRTKTRKALNDHMMTSLISNKRLALYLKEQSNRYKPAPSAATIGRFRNDDPNSTKVGHDFVATVELYLLDLGLLSPDQPRGKPPIEPTNNGSLQREASQIHDPNFRMLCAQFNIDDKRVTEIAADYRGTYQFYAHSEETRGHVVYGAMTMFQGSKNMGPYKKTNGLLVKEVQTGKKGGLHDAFEKWVGYFLECRNICVIFNQSRTLHIPKLYVLEPERRERRTARVTRMLGRMLKVGTNGGVFSTRVLMIRNKNAYSNCNLVPFGDTPTEIQEALSAPDT